MNQKSQRDQAHIRTLDGLRGCAALAVTMFHGILHFNVSLIPRVLYAPAQSLSDGTDIWVKFLLAIFNGDSAVILFFVLSGYVLGASLDRTLDRGEPALVTSIEFLVKRVARIYPAMFFCMLVYMLLSFVFVPHIEYPVISPITAFQSATLYDIGVHGPSWSLLVEVVAAPFVVAFVLLRRTFGFFALVLAIGYAMLAIDYPVLVGSLPNLWPYLVSFGIGVALSSPEFKAIDFDVKPTHLAISIVLFVFARHFVARGNISGLIVHSFLAGLVVFTASRAYRGLAYKFLISRPVQFLGRISYSFYLLNVPILYAVWGTILIINPHPEKHYLLWGVGSALVTTILTLPLAVFSERFIERPGIFFISSLIRRVNNLRKSLAHAS
ncbi:Acyltransferase family protein [Caballeronia sp. SBC1]|uniref:acyltransferase family protein n=1 Tax=Caballeronia sp. SBC1 TaxID=2705548 RepID=UPI00140C7FFB|nr:acyltransferase [Caballeronia sp. SBC1]QIN62861.1 Acyltransferase family protein [Caballeronia sp. SBC1]